jgi:hypothetical protein
MRISHRHGLGFTYKPQKVVFISNIFFLSFSAPGFWLLLFGRFGFYYSNWLLLFKKVYLISAPEYRFSLSSQFNLLFNLYIQPRKRRFYRGKTKKVFFSARVSVFSIQLKRFSLSKFRFSLSKPRYTIYRFSLSSQKGFLYPNSGFLYPNHGILYISPKEGFTTAKLKKSSSAPEYRFSLSSQFYLLFNLYMSRGPFFSPKEGFTAAKLKKSSSAPEYRFSLSSQKGFLYPNSGFLYPNHGILYISQKHIFLQGSHNF